MKTIKTLGIIGLAVFVLLILTSDNIATSLLSFIMAGIIPGTNWQLPWYIVLILMPLLLFGVWRLVQSIDFSHSAAAKQTTNLAASNKQKASRRKTSPRAKRQTASKKTTRRTTGKLSQAEA